MIDFASAMFFYEILDGFSRLAQWIRFINDRDDFARLKKLFEEKQIFFDVVAIPMKPIFLLPILDSNGPRSSAWII